MPTPITESTGASANFPASFQGPADGDPAVALSINQPLTDLANRTQWLRALGADQVLGLLADRGITASPADPSLLTQAVYAVVDRVATAIGGAVKAAGNVLIDGYSDGFQSPNASLYVSASASPNGGSGAPAVEVRGSGTANALQVYGGSGAPAGRFFGYSSAPALRSNNTATGSGARFESVAHHGTESVVQAANYAAYCAYVNAADAIGLTILSAPNLGDHPGIWLQNRIQFSPALNSEPGVGSGSLPDKNSLYAKNIVKAWGAFDANRAVRDGFNLRSVTETQTGEWEVWFDQPMASANYVVNPAWQGLSANGYKLEVRGQTADSFRMGCYQQTGIGAWSLTSFNAPWGYTVCGAQ